MQCWRRACAWACAALSALLLLGAPGVAAAQVSDPAAVIAAYTAALNAHDTAAAIDLFDEFGSASDAAGHNFYGRDGLTTFLDESGLVGPDARVTTQNIHVVANRAVWTFTCSCAPAPIQARVVTNNGRIVVLALARPPAVGTATTSASTSALGGQPWLVVAIAGGMLALNVIRRLRRPPARVPRASEGRLLRGLRDFRGDGLGPPG